MTTRRTLVLTTGLLAGLAMASWASAASATSGSMWRSSADSVNAASVTDAASVLSACSGVSSETVAAFDYLDMLDDSDSSQGFGFGYAHFDWSKLGPAQLKQGFEWLVDWDGTRFRNALNGARGNVPAESLGAFDAWVDAVATWADIDKATFPNMEVLSGQRFGYVANGGTSIQSRFAADDQERTTRRALEFALGSGVTIYSATFGVTWASQCFAWPGGEGTPAIGDNGEDTDDGADPGIDDQDLDTLSNEDLLAIITGAAFDDLTESMMQDVFAALDAEALDSEAERTLSTLSDAAKRVLERTVDVYGAGLDQYVPVGSRVTVSVRRTLLAGALVVAAAATTGGIPTSGSGVTAGGGASRLGRREDEVAQQSGVADVKGPGYRTQLRQGRSAAAFKAMLAAHATAGDDQGTFNRNSIYRYSVAEGVEMKKFTASGFVRKFVRETAAVAFTLAGSIIVIGTLSGATRTIALVATVTAAVLHFGYVMADNDQP